VISVQGELDARTGLSVVLRGVLCGGKRPDNRQCWFFGSCQQISVVNRGCNVLFRTWNWSRLAAKVCENLELEPSWTRMQRCRSSPMSDLKSGL